MDEAGYLDHQPAHTDHAAINNIDGSISLTRSVKLFIVKSLDSRALAELLNLVFTRIVNHCVTVFGD